MPRYVMEWKKTRKHDAMKCTTTRSDETRQKKQPMRLFSVMCASFCSCFALPSVKQCNARQCNVIRISLPNSASEFLFRIYLPNLSSELLFRISLPNVSSQFLFRIYLPNFSSEVLFRISGPNLSSEFCFAISLPSFSTSATALRALLISSGLF